MTMDIDIAVGQAAPLYAKVMNSPPVLIAHASLIARAISMRHHSTGLLR